MDHVKTIKNNKYYILLDLFVAPVSLICTQAKINQGQKYSREFTKWTQIKSVKKTKNTTICKNDNARPLQDSIIQVLQTFTKVYTQK